jgi:hypothetical protein
MIGHWNPLSFVVLERWYRSGWRAHLQTTDPFQCLAARIGSACFVDLDPQLIGVPKRQSANQFRSLDLISPPAPFFDFASIALLPSGTVATVPFGVPPAKTRHTKQKMDKKTAPIPSSACGKPLRLEVVTSGPFRDGHCVEDYYPDLVGQDLWAHGSSAGPFITSKRIGANVQLVGTIGPKCPPGEYHFTQIATNDVLRADGTVAPTEGQSFDDLARSGWNSEQPPFRQTKLPHISIADIPSVPQPAPRGIRNARAETTYVTSLQGPAGSETVTWRTAVEIKDGQVIKNSVK